MEKLTSEGELAEKQLLLTFPQISTGYADHVFTMFLKGQRDLHANNTAPLQFNI